MGNAILITIVWIFVGICSGFSVQEYIMKKKLQDKIWSIILFGSGILVIGLGGKILYEISGQDACFGYLGVSAMGFCFFVILGAVIKQKMDNQRK